MRLAALIAGAAVGLAAGRAGAELRAVSVRCESTPEPHVEAILEVTPNQRPAADYVLAIDPRRPRIEHGRRLQRGDVRPLALVLVIDGSATFLAKAPPENVPDAGVDSGLHALDEVAHAIDGFAAAAGGAAKLGIVVADRRATVVAPLGPAAAWPRRGLGGEDDHEGDQFDLDGGLLAALQLFEAAPAGARRIVVVIGVPRRPPSADIAARLVAAPADVLTLEVDRGPGRRVMQTLARFGGVGRRWFAERPDQLPSLAARMVEQIDSVVRVEFAMPADALDGRAHDVELRLGDELVAIDQLACSAPPGGAIAAAGSPPSRGGAPWLLLGGALSAALVIGGLLLLRRRARVAGDPGGIVHRTVPISAPQSAPEAEEPEAVETYAPPPPAFAAWFYVLEGGRKGQTLALRRGGVTLAGRGDAQLRLDDDGVRPRHAKLLARAGRVTIVALPDGASVRVGGQDVPRAELEDGMIVELGSAKLLYKATV